MQLRYRGGQAKSLTACRGNDIQTLCCGSTGNFEICATQFDCDSGNRMCAILRVVPQGGGFRSSALSDCKPLIRVLLLSHPSYNYYDNLRDCLGMDQVCVRSRVHVLQSNIVVRINVSLPRQSHWPHGLRRGSWAARLLAGCNPAGVLDVCLL